MLNHNGIAVWLWQFRMGLNNDELLPFETRLFWIMARNPVSWILSSVNATTIHITKQYFAAHLDRLNSQITKVLHELYFTNTFLDTNLYTFASKMLLTRSSDMSNFAVTT